MPRASSIIGRALPRVDGYAKVSGSARYADDLGRPGMIYGSTVRSEVAHGKLLGLARDPAFDWSDITFVTAADVRGRNAIVLIEDDQPALVPVGGTIRHADEPVALVAAPTALRARQAAAHVRLAVEALPTVLDLEDALRAEVCLRGNDNVFKRIEIHHGGDVGAALAGADHVIEGTYRTGAQEQMYIEPQGMLAWWEEDRCYVQGSMQCPYYVHSALQALHGVSRERVVVGQAVTGGGFGGKEEYPSLLAAHASLLARKAGAPVKMVYDRAEDIGATTKRHPARVEHRLGIRSDGTLAAVDVDVVFDAGAYLTLSAVVLSRGVLHAAGPYRCPVVRIVGRAVATNTPPHGAFRGFGAPQTTFAYERQMDKAARRLGMDPWELRRRNVFQVGDTTPTGQELTFSVAGQRVLDDVQRVVSGEPPPSSDGRTARGRGIALCFHGTGFTGSREARVKGKVTVAATRAGFEVRSSSADIGQGAATTLTQLAADALGVAPEHVRVAVPSTDRVPDSGPTVASRTCMVVGKILSDAATELRARLIGASEAGSADDLVALARAWVQRHGELALTRQYEPPTDIRWDEASYRGDAYAVYGWAACCADVAVDRDTAEVTVERLIHAVDAGRAINPVIVKGQIEGGALQAVGWALRENVSYLDGRVANRRMTDCIIPTALDAPEMETIIVEDPYPHGPHGAKGVGEIPMDGPAAAIANALCAALAAEFDTLPMLPETIAATEPG